MRFFSNIMPVSWSGRLKNFKSNGFLILLVLGLSVTFACSSLILINYYTIKSLSAIRAFINGESQYSKAQKDGSRNLLLYMSERDEHFYQAYKQNLNINIGDSLALKGLYAGLEREELIGNFIKGRNDAADADDMIWLLRNFKEVSYMKKCVQYWLKANEVIRIMDRRVTVIHERIQKGFYSGQELVSDSKSINDWDNSISQLYTGFSETLGLASRSVRKLLIVCDFTFILLIVGFSGAYSATTISRLLFSAKALATKNQALIHTNTELDRLVYSASHELRAPITSLKGLVHIIKEETDLVAIRNYLDLVDKSLHQQDTIIREIINYSKNKRTELTAEKFLLNDLIDSAIDEFSYLSTSNQITYLRDIAVNEIISDAVRLKIILNNLISNAIKFIDTGKSVHTILIRSSCIGKELKIEIEDNGIGIQPDQKDKIFEMFYVTLHANRGTGLGLYITRETVEKLGGRIELTSVLGKGSCFGVYIPVNII